MSQDDRPAAPPPAPVTVPERRGYDMIPPPAPVTPPPSPNPVPLREGYDFVPPPPPPPPKEGK
jgi:hypothetical protein